MAIYKLYPLQDNTLYSGNPSINAGIDPILEIANTVNSFGTNDVRRCIIQFNQHDINNIINNKISGSYYDVYLKLYNAESHNITGEFNIELYPLAESWINGNGYYLDIPENINGSSWIYKDGITPWITSNYDSNTTDSFVESNPGGGSWYYENIDINNPNIALSQSINLNSSLDLTIKITDIINSWYSASYDISNINEQLINNGIILKLDSNNEFNTSSQYQPQLKYYSKETNTIYKPYLEFKWDDSIYITGGLTPLIDSDLYINIYNNKGEFYSDSINKFKICSRPKYPTRTYQTSSLYIKDYYLPSSSYYAIKDLNSNEIVVDFDENYTKLSCNNQGNYFNLDMNSLEDGRNYCILIKTIIDDSEIIIDSKFNFKIIDE